MVRVSKVVAIELKLMALEPYIDAVRSPNGNIYLIVTIME